MNVAIVDCGSGNLRSAANAVERTAAEEGIAARIEVTNEPETVARADRVVLPGVGAFADCRRGLAAVPGLEAALRETATVRARPFLGICVGMQWLYSGSTEAPSQPGLAQFPESCSRFPDGREKVPHVGWNSLQVQDSSRLFSGISSGEYVYFTHSYKAPVTPDTAAVADYIEPFAAAVERGNVMGVQFHPEKSGATGLKILRNFLEWTC